MDFTDLERAVILGALDNLTEFKNELTRQYEMAKVAYREMTGVGFITKIEIEPTAPKLPAQSLGDCAPIVEIEGLKHGMVFNLFLKNGYLDELEGFKFGSDTGKIDDLTDRVFRII